jgi:hypothetical protein
MPTAEVTNVLTKYGLLPPDLEMLRPTSNRYTTILMQPSGPIQATTDRIGPLDVNAASAKGLAFLQKAIEKSAHLAITPEYFFPWSELKKVICEGIHPNENALWVLGAESITAEDLERFKIEIEDVCIVHFEPLEGLQTDRTLLDPVVMLFQAKNEDGLSRLIALIQFKTHHSRDDVFFEEGLLKKGTTIYKFKGLSGHLSTAVIICSDAFALNAPWLYDFNHLSTLIHIQLNPNPRQAAYRQYRTTTFLQDPRSSSCHIISLNWAHSIIQHGDDQSVDKWKNISGSTWYCPLDDCSVEDDIVLPNHNHGLYYAYMTERRHALMFHYDEAVFELLVPKLLTLDFGVVANRNGPSAIERLEWNSEKLSWLPATTTPDSGFNQLLNNNEQAKLALSGVIQTNNPMYLEKILALSAGNIDGTASWHATKNVDSCQIGQNEFVKRITVVQDTEETEFRSQRLDVAAQIHHLILNLQRWPPQVEDLDAQASIQWDKATPHFNVISKEGLLTLIVFLGERPPPQVLETKTAMFFDLLRKWGGEFQNRLCIAYREFGDIKFAPISALTVFDDPMVEMTDFMSVESLEYSGGLDD